MSQIYRKKLFYWGKDFDEYMEKFDLILKADKRMIDSVQDRYKNMVLKNGLTSHGIKQLIKEYVKANWGAYSKRFKQKDGNSVNASEVEEASEEF